MSRKTGVFVCFIVFIVSLFLVPEVSCAPATKMAVSGLMIPTGVGAPDKEWVAGNISHLRGFTEMGEFQGDLQGSYSAVGNNNINVSTGKGQAFGKLTLILTWNGLTGTFEGSYVAKVSDFGESLTLWGVAQCTSGDLVGMKFLGTATWLSPGPYEYEGFIIDPHDD